MAFEQTDSIFNGTRMVAWIFPIIAGSMIQRSGGIPRVPISLGTIYLLGLIVPWLVSETSGKPLPTQTAVLVLFVT